MKHFPILLLAILITLFTSSCTNSASEDVAENSNSKHATQLVRFNIAEEQTSIAQNMPRMTRAGSEGKKFYAINIYKVAKKGLTKYAFGLFDSTDSMKLTLNTDDKYKIECIELCNDEDTLYHEGNTFYYPFMRNKKPGTLTNKFIKSTTENNDIMASGNVSISKKDTTYYPRLYTYYGELSNFDPSVTTSANIELRRSVFGLHFIITPPSDGSVFIRYLNDWTINIKAGDSVYDHQSIYSFHTIKKAIEEGYSGSFRPALDFTYSDGSTRHENIDVPITRNTITTIMVDLSHTTTGGVSFNEETTPIVNKDTVKYAF